MASFTDVMPLDALEDEEPTPASINGVNLCLVRVDDKVYALNDVCTHEVAPLSDGFVEDGCIECPLHQGTFDLETGEARREPCVVDVQTYPVRITDGMVSVDVTGGHGKSLPHEHVEQLGNVPITPISPVA